MSQQVKPTLESIAANMATIAANMATIVAEMATTRVDMTTIRADMATKEDLKAFATKKDFTRLEIKVDAMQFRLDKFHKDNNHQHLKTREMIGDLNRRHTILVEGQIKAAKAAM